ncbi:MAG: TPM domain-containing protein [Sphingomonadaceae bacterium]
MTIRQMPRLPLQQTELQQVRVALPVWLMRRFLPVILIVLAGLAGTMAAAQDYPPRPDGPVYDGAQILSPTTIAELDSRLRAYNQATGRAIVVATVPDLDGQPIESYATGLFGNWGIGGAQRDMGLLLLIAPNERKMRIEIGYGMHPWFGGIMAGRVIRDVITPYFKQDDYDGGVKAGVDAIITHLDKSPEDAQAIEEAAVAAQQNQSENEDSFPIGAALWFLFMFFFFYLPSLRGARGRRYSRGNGIARDVGNIILWETLNSASRGDSSRSSGGGWGSGFPGGSGGGFSGGFGGFGGGMSGGGGASGGW